MSKFPVYNTLAIEATKLCHHNKIPKNVETVFYQEKPIRLEDKTHLKKIGACNTCKECKERGIPICECWWKPDVMKQNPDDTRLLNKCSIFSIEEHEKKIHEVQDGLNDYWGRANSLKNQYKNVTIIDKFRQSYRKSKNFWLKQKVGEPGQSVTWIMEPQAEIKSSREELKEKRISKQIKTKKSSEKMLKSYIDNNYDLGPAKSFLAKIQAQKLAKSINANTALPSSNIQTQKPVNEKFVLPTQSNQCQKPSIDLKPYETERQLQVNAKEMVKILEPKNKEEDTNIKIDVISSKEKLTTYPLDKINNTSKSSKSFCAKTKNQKKNIEEHQQSTRVKLKNEILSSQKMNNSKYKKSYVPAKAKIKMPIRSQTKAAAKVDNKNSPTITNMRQQITNLTKPTQTEDDNESLAKNSADSLESSETTKALESKQDNGEGKQDDVKALETRKDSCQNESLRHDKSLTKTSSQYSVEKRKETIKALDNDSLVDQCQHSDTLESEKAQGDAINKTGKSNQTSDETLVPSAPQRHALTNTKPSEKAHKAQEGCVHNTFEAYQETKETSAPHPKPKHHHKSEKLRKLKTL